MIAIPRPYSCATGYCATVIPRNSAPKLRSRPVSCAKRSPNISANASRRENAMKITDVEVLVLKSPGLYANPEGAEEPPGPTYMGVMRVSTDSGITGYSDMETAPTVAKAVVDAPRWSEPGMECFDGLRSLILGENPLEVERLWYKMYRGSIYYGRRGVAIQAISAIDIALWDIAGKFYQQPIHILLGGKWHQKIRAYASTLFRPNPDAMRDAAKSYIDEGFTAVKFGWG